jgi:hypothetical protein
VGWCEPFVGEDVDRDARRRAAVAMKPSSTCEPSRLARPEEVKSVALQEAGINSFS